MSYIFQFPMSNVQLQDQLNSKNLQMKLCMCLPKFHQQYFLKPSVLYIAVHILGSYKYNLVVQFPISNVHLFFGTSLLLTCSKMTHASISSPHFFFLQQTDSLKSCIKQSQSYLKSQKIEIKSNLEILFYTVFVGKLQATKVISL